MNKLNLITLILLLIITKALARTISVSQIDSPKIDGRIEHLEWQGASRDSGFIQIEPGKGEPISQRTFVYIAMDSRTLFIAFECLTSDIHDLSAGNRQRDQGSLEGEDGVVLLLDTFHDGRSAYLFHVNLLNAQTDWRIEHNGGSIDNNWDAEWKSAVRSDEYGWYAELAIPLKSIKFSSMHGRWGGKFRTINCQKQ